MASLEDDDYMDDSSELSDDDEDELEDEDMSIEPPEVLASRPAAKSRKSVSPQKQKEVKYELGHRLRPANLVTRTTTTIAKLIKDGDIDLNPDYQRSEVWPVKAQSKLIDSLLRNYYIPPVLLSVRKGPTGSDRYTCVDGKQRLTSICGFLAGEIPHIDLETKKKYWYTAPKKAKGGYTLLPEHYRKDFERVFVPCFHMTGLSEEEEREIFQRVQMGMVLSTAEKWQALQGPWPVYLSELKREYFNTEDQAHNILGHIKWDVTRAKDFQDLIRMALAVNATILSSPPVPVPTRAEEIELLLRNETGPSSEFKETMVAILERLLQLVKDPACTHAFSGKVAPVELVLMGILIGRNLVLSNEQLADAIAAMRACVRSQTEKGYLMYKPKIVESAIKWIRAYNAPSPVPAVRGIKRRQADVAADTSDEEPLASRTVRQKTAAKATKKGEGNMVVSSSRATNRSSSPKKSSSSKTQNQKLPATSSSNTQSQSSRTPTAPNTSAVSQGNKSKASTAPITLNGATVSTASAVSKDSKSIASTGPITVNGAANPSPLPRPATLPRGSESRQGAIQKPIVTIPPSLPSAQSPQASSAQVLPTTRPSARTPILSRPGPTLEEEIADLQGDLAKLVESEKASGGLTTAQAEQKRLREEKLQKLRSELFLQQILNSRVKKPPQPSLSAPSPRMRERDQLKESQRPSLFGRPSGALGGGT